jgi:hypothetical protein
VVTCYAGCMGAGAGAVAVNGLSLRYIDEKLSDDPRKTNAVTYTPSHRNSTICHRWGVYVDFWGQGVGGGGQALCRPSCEWG